MRIDWHSDWCHFCDFCHLLLLKCGDICRTSQSLQREKKVMKIINANQLTTRKLGNARGSQSGSVMIAENSENSSAMMILVSCHVDINRFIARPR